MLARLAGSWWTRLAVTAAILAWLATRIDMAAAARAVLSVSLPHLAAVLALVAVDRGVMVWRWILLLRARGVPVGRRAGGARVPGQLVRRQLPARRHRRRRRAGLVAGRGSRRAPAKRSPR